MRLKNRLIILGICFGVAMLAQAACGGQPDLAQSQDADITVREIVNWVEVNSLNPETNERKFVELQLGQSLITGNLVKTHEFSSTRVDISIQNFSRVSRTAPKTVWELGRFALDGGAVIELQEGKVFVFDEDDGEDHWPLHIVTPAGTASARGTWMAVEFDPESGTVRVECLRGICELENDFGYQVFTNQHTVAATALTGPTVPVPMQRPEIEVFHDLPEVLSGELVIPAPFTPIEAQIKLEKARSEALQQIGLVTEQTLEKQLTDILARAAEQVALATRGPVEGEIATTEEPADGGTATTLGPSTGNDLSIGKRLEGNFHDTRDLAEDDVLVTDEPANDGALATEDPSGDELRSTKEPAADDAPASEEPVGSDALATGEPAESEAEVQVKGTALSIQKRPYIEAEVTEEPAQGETVGTDDPAQGEAVVAEKPAAGEVVVAEEPAEGEAVVAEEPADVEAIATEDPSEGEVVVSEEPAATNAVGGEKSAEGQSQGSGSQGSQWSGAGQRRYNPNR